MSSAWAVINHSDEPESFDANDVILSSDTKGWRFVGMSPESGPFVIDGLNVWDYEWESSSQSNVSLPSPGIGTSILSVSIYRVTEAGRQVDFGCTDVSYGCYAFYVRADSVDNAREN